MATRPIAAGSVIGPDDLTWKRPAHGISPRHYEEVIGRTADVDIAEDDLLRWSMLR